MQVKREKRECDSSNFSKPHSEKAQEDNTDVQVVVLCDNTPGEL